MDTFILGLTLGLTLPMLLKLMWRRGPFKLIDLVEIDHNDHLMTVSIDQHLTQFRRRHGVWFNYLSNVPVQGVDNAYLEELFDEHQLLED